MKRRPAFHVLILLAVVCAAPVVAQTSKTLATAPAVPAAAQAESTSSSQRLKVDGLPNLGRVSRQVLRGGQPNPAGFDELKKLGVGIVVNLRHETDDVAREKEFVTSRGMQYVNIPWRGSQDPNPAQVAEFLEVLQANHDKQVFVHCQRGAERTGVMVACYRITSDKWTADKALHEMEQFGFRGWRFGHLKKFVREFPSLLLNGPVFKTMRNPG